MARIEQGLYVCTPECAQGAVHEASGCEACHDPDCPHLIDFGTWLTAYCERCARQMRRDGHRISDKGAPLDDDQLQLDLPACRPARTPTAGPPRPGRTRERNLRDQPSARADQP